MFPVEWGSNSSKAYFIYWYWSYVKGTDFCFNEDEVNLWVDDMNCGDYDLRSVDIRIKELGFCDKSGFKCYYYNIWIVLFNYFHITD